MDTSSGAAWPGESLVMCQGGVGMTRLLLRTYVRTIIALGSEVGAVGNRGRQSPQAW